MFVKLVPVMTSQTAWLIRATAALSLAPRDLPWRPACAAPRSSSRLERPVRARPASVAESPALAAPASCVVEDSPQRAKSVLI